MQIQVNTDNTIEGSESLSREVQAVLESQLRRFASQITRVEVFFTDENSPVRSGGDDKRCVIEARLEGLAPLSASDRAPSVARALDGAVRKLRANLESTLGKRARR